MTGDQIKYAAHAWRRGFDTVTIAEALHVEEALVYRWLFEVKKVARAMK